MKKLRLRDRTPLRTRPNSAAYCFAVVLVGISGWIESGRENTATPLDRKPAYLREQTKPSAFQTHQSTKIYPAGSDPGYVEVHFGFSFTPTNPLGFSDLVDLYRGTAETNKITLLLAKQKAFPLNFVQSEVKLIEEGSGKTSYVIEGWLKGFYYFTRSQSRLNCREAISASTWIQDCALDAAYEESTKFLTLYKTHTACSENKDRSMQCQIDYAAQAKPVDDIPLLVAKFIGVRRYSANQSAFKIAENTLKNAYAQMSVLNFTPPLIDHVEKAMKHYFANVPGKNEVDELVRHYPAEPDTVQSYSSD